MDPIASKYSVWKRILHKFQARRDIPFRKRFFVGYDLHGNTYWEFTPDGNMRRLRRKMEPHTEYMFKADYFSTIPPQWLQWLRRTREHAPSLYELMEDQVRQQNIKLLAKLADSKWMEQKMQLEQQQQMKLQAELDRVKEKTSKTTATPEIPAATPDEPASSNNTSQSTGAADPWAEAEKAQEEDYNPIQAAKIPIRKK